MELTDIQAAIEQHAATTADTIATQASTIAKLTRELDGVKADLSVLEQKASEIDFNPMLAGSRSNLASSLVSNDMWQQVANKKTTRTQVEVKTSELLGLETKNTVTGNDGSFGPKTHAGIYGGLERRRFLIDYLNIIPVLTGSVEYTKESSFTNNAAPQAGGSPLEWEGQNKAESALVYTLEDLRIPTIAHFVKASNQVLADVPQLRNILDGRLRYGLSVKLDSQIINGTGANANMAGLTKSGNFTAFTPTTGESAIDSINRAIASLETNEAAPTLVLLNPTTWRSLQRVKSGGSEEYLFGSPSGQNRESIWNVEVLPTNAIAAGKLLVIDAATLGEFYLRQDATIDVGFVNDDFTKNLVTIRGEMRGAVAVVRAEAVIFGDITQ